ncbi:MAG TPA: M48 family metallopeptidase [Bacillota bacterium]|jgi:heat shock protein HtpX|nr:M48 family metallopeptidase [Bacillota bacterium]HOB86943.1 M48 family metallopeptidase [Bacillota bacterium]HOP69073.1 M48 family metallopeptidase [Bacillota bacterium]HPT34746.1 M48 family metallopeptidase [Bacillota bacterium]HPZ65314.1 M48 family metallopeptidase [Bacillota bacterium]
MIPVYGHIAANKRRTILLFLLFGLLFVGLGYGIGYWLGEPWLGIALAGLVFVVVLLTTYFGGQNVVAAMAGAHPVSKEEEPYLYHVVEGLSIAAGRPMPRIYIIETDVPNAFAAGRNPQQSLIAVTRGLLKRLNRLELEGVIAHEMAHIHNYDVLIATVAIVMAGTVIFVTEMLRRSLWWSGPRHRSSSSRGRGQGQGQGQVPALILVLVLSILAPLFAQLLRFAISREREFLADSTAAEFTGYPEGLASALEKIAAEQVPQSPIDREPLQGLYIVSPSLGVRAEDRLSVLFSTHPPIAERIRRLREM